MAKGIIEVLYCKDCGGYTVVDLKKLWALKECPTCESQNIEVWNETEEKENK